MYAMSIHVRNTREYEFSQSASQKRRKTRMRRAMIEQRDSTRKSGARVLFCFHKGTNGNRKHLA